jgi:hypothetical protein
MFTSGFQKVAESEASGYAKGTAVGAVAGGAAGAAGAHHVTRRIREMTERAVPNSKVKVSGQGRAIAGGAAKGMLLGAAGGAFLHEYRKRKKKKQK